MGRAAGQAIVHGTTELDRTERQSTLPYYTIGLVLILCVCSLILFLTRQELLIFTFSFLQMSLKLRQKNLFSWVVEEPDWSPDLLDPNPPFLTKIVHCLPQQLAFFHFHSLLSHSNKYHQTPGLCQKQGLKRRREESLSLRADAFKEEIHK